MTTLTKIRAAVRVPIPAITRPAADSDPDEYDEDTARMQEWFIRHDRAGKWLSVAAVIAAAVMMACGVIPR